MDEDQIWDLSDEELERAFKEAKAEEQSPEVGEELEETEEVEPEVEQPDEEEDSDVETEEVEEGEDETDEVEEEGSEEEEEESDPDEGEEADDEKPEAEAEEVEEAPKEVQKYKFKANGKEYEFTEEEIKEKFPAVFGQAMDYTRKMQAIKPWRKTIDAIETANLTHEEINLFIDARKGDKGAITELLKRTGVNAFELDDEADSKYVPNDYGRDETALAIKDVVDEIKSDREYDTTHKILSQEWDENSFKELTANPNLIKLLHTDVKTGMYDKVQPIAEKLKVFDRGTKSDLEYYRMAAQEYFRDQDDSARHAKAIEEQRIAKEAKAAKQAELERVKAKAAKQVAVKEKAQVRKAAAPTKSNAGTKKVTDYLDESDEAYDEWYQKNVLDKM